ncbi:hypothetical protein Lal_00007041 [Lupinus albus]|nr:hypothetical protein Lal_00007041 [Lupinus albus]
MQDMEKQENPSVQQDNQAADAAAATASEQAAPAAEPTLEDKLAAAEARAAEMQDAFLRARAEGENIRRRAQEDIAKAHKFAIEGFAESLLAPGNGPEDRKRLAGIAQGRRGHDLEATLLGLREEQAAGSQPANRREARPDEAPGRLGRAGRAGSQHGGCRAAKRLYDFRPSAASGAGDGGPGKVSGPAPRGDKRKRHHFCLSRWFRRLKVRLSSTYSNHSKHL